MPPPGPSRTLKNESKYPHIVELAVDSHGLDVELSRRIIEFHKSRHIQPRHGRVMARQGGGFYYRWCFADLPIATAFVEQFGGEFYKPGI